MRWCLRGIEAILNYAPIIVQVPANVRIRHIDPMVALQSMTYYVQDERQEAGAGAGRNGLGASTSERGQGSWTRESQRFYCSSARSGASP